MLSKAADIIHPARDSRQFSLSAFSGLLSQYCETDGSSEFGTRTMILIISLTCSSGFILEGKLRVEVGREISKVVTGRILIHVPTRGVLVSQ